jgi:GxxExxY protein
MKLLHGEITEQIIGAAFEVHRVLGYGFLEKVYQKAMTVELERRGLTVIPEASASVYYREVCVGEYYADLLVADKVIVELKTAKDLNLFDEAQLINEVRATRREVGLLINFGRDGVRFIRVVNQVPVAAREPAATPSAESALSVANRT